MKDNNKLPNHPSFHPFIHVSVTGVLGAAHSNKVQKGKVYIGMSLSPNINMSESNK